MTYSRKGNRLICWLSEYSLPLIGGVICALVISNLAPNSYSALVHTPVTSLFQARDHGFEHEAHEHEAHLAANHSAESSVGEHRDAETSDWGHFFTMHFLVNEIFMVFFFGVAAKEITEACLPNGALNPIKKAINPLFATCGGILGPVGMYLGLNALFGDSAWSNGWGIPTATDIALAWLVAKLIFGEGHPAISFLLLLAVADDAIGLVIIAIAYPDPHHPAVWANLWWIIPGMLSAYAFRMLNVKSWVPYIFVGGSLCWWGLFSAHLHPALSLVFVVPFLPGQKKDLGFYVEDETAKHTTPLDNFEHDLRLFVDFGLFFFALANAGVVFSGVNGLTWIVLASLMLGKTIGVTLFSMVASQLGFPLSKGMEFCHLAVTAVISGLGLTVALFVSGQAFANPILQDAAKMGAVLSVGAAVLAYAAAVSLGIVRFPENWREKIFRAHAKGLPSRRNQPAGS